MRDIRQATRDPRCARCAAALDGRRRIAPTSENGELSD
ncbi:hypothetical protein BURPS668_A1111 [Burkholderia pseudomallei 668]|nr:hypothetical protein BURPS668_A1111 [Burkholderia pseudomallei 668]